MYKNGADEWVVANSIARSATSSRAKRSSAAAPTDGWLWRIRSSEAVPIGLDRERAFVAEALAGRTSVA
jgi:hypothetical protein